MKVEQMHMDDFVSSASQPGEGQLLLWVNSDQVSFHPVELPAVPARKLAKMLPWLVEEQLLGPPESMHLVCLAAAADESDTLVAVPNDCMWRWANLLGESGASVRALVPDLLALPWQKGSISLARQGERWLVRTGVNSGFSGSPEFVQPMLARHLQADTNLQLHCYGFDQPPLDLADTALFLQPASIDWSRAEAPALNLLTRPYRPGGARGSLGRWWPAVAAGLLAFALGLAYTAVDYRAAGVELAQVNQALNRDYQALFGVPAPALQGLQRAAEAELRQREQRYLAETSSVLPMLRQLDPALSNCRNCLLQSIRLTGQSAELVLNADAAALGSLQQLTGWRATRQPEGDNLRLLLERTSP